MNENQNILDAIDLIKDFVGESVPVVDNHNNIVGIVTESDLFNQLLIAENIRKRGVIRLTIFFLSNFHHN